MLNQKQRSKEIAMKEYMEELISLVEDKTKLNFYSYRWDLNTRHSDILRLERFIHNNNIGDTCVIWAKYEKRIKLIYGGN